MKNQILSIKQMKHLEGLGVDINRSSVMIGEVTEEQGGTWYNNESWELAVICNINEYGDDENETDNFRCKYRSFTLQDMLEMMPKSIKNDELEYDLTIYACNEDCWVICYLRNYGYEEQRIYIWMKHDELLEAAYEMLCWLDKNKYLNQQQ